ncbi:S8 family serine peptidase [Anaerobacillus sp. CMMVII]|uniref:S8 family serine peptidase n=1 Tax=Anaerobacillus sp. CMMVII TaxID=2755588 RepID=UPI0021B7490F|nr:S8 family serine peptidase [Anaerobacillus sp. CMMVII]MCT8140325.1 S8 family serine peptidase [Anaerobacillus sp. CMMVII]
MKMKRYLFLLLFLLGVYSLGTSAYIEEEKETVIILYQNESGKKAIEKLATEIEHQFESIPALVATLTDSQIERLEDYDVHIEKNQKFNVTTEETFTILPITSRSIHSAQIKVRDAHDLWNIDQVNAQAAWANGFTGSKVKVAVVDSGIAPHPDLHIVGGVSTIPYTKSWTDDNGHGTLVAGTIAANGNGISGVAPNVELYAVKALDRDGEGTLQSVLSALDWSIKNGMDIINFSLGTDSDIQSLREMIDVAYKNGILLVAASGNSGNSNGTGDSVQFPAKYQNVIAVGAVDQNLVRAPFSSTGNQVEFAAPGVNIISTSLHQQYAVATGTSFAAPHIAGMLAVLKEMHPGKTNSQLRTELQQLVVDLGAPGRDPWYGFGFAKFADTPNLSRISGANLYETSALISKEGWETSEVVILARGDRFSDALTGVPLAAKYDAPLLLSRSNRLDTHTKNELERLQAKRVIILGGTLAIEPRVETEIRDLGIKVERLAGSNMHATAELIAKQVAPNGSDIAMVVTDSRFQDALSVASYAGVRGIPILLTNTDRLSTATKRALQELGVKETLVIGGELAVSGTVEKQLPNPTRISGRTLYHTNIEAFRYFQPNTHKVYVATANRFPDGLSAGALAARENVGVIFVGSTLHAVTKENFLNTQYGKVKVLGGHLAVNEQVYGEIFKLLK